MPPLANAFGIKISNSDLLGLLCFSHTSSLAVISLIDSVIPTLATSVKLNFTAFVVFSLFGNTSNKFTTPSLSLSKTLFGSVGYWSCSSATPSPSSSVSVLLPIPSPSVSNHSLASKGKASSSLSTPSLSLSGSLASGTPSLSRSRRLEIKLTRGSNGAAS